jgi:hypothetical protein
MQRIQCFMSKHGTLGNSWFSFAFSLPLNLCVITFSWLYGAAGLTGGALHGLWCLVG